MLLWLVGQSVGRVVCWRLVSLLDWSADLNLKLALLGSGPIRGDDLWYHHIGGSLLFPHLRHSQLLLRPSHPPLGSSLRTLLAAFEALPVPS